MESVEVNKFLERTSFCNKLIVVMTQYGRKFFISKNRYWPQETHIGHFVSTYIASHSKVPDSDGFILHYVDHYTQLIVFPLTEDGKWENFTNGSTLRCLIYDMSRYIKGEVEIQRVLGHCKSNHCGYDRELSNVQDEWYELAYVHLERINSLSGV